MPPEDANLLPWLTHSMWRTWVSETPLLLLPRLVSETCVLLLLRLVPETLFCCYWDLLGVENDGIEPTNIFTRPKIWKSFLKVMHFCKTVWEISEFFIISHILHFWKMLFQSWIFKNQKSEMYIFFVFPIVVEYDFFPVSKTVWW